MTQGVGPTVKDILPPPAIGKAKPGKAKAKAKSKTKADTDKAKQVAEQDDEIAKKLGKDVACSTSSSSSSSSSSD